MKQNLDIHKESFKSLLIHCKNPNGPENKGEDVSNFCWTHSIRWVSSPYFHLDMLKISQASSSPFQETASAQVARGSAIPLTSKEEEFKVTTTKQGLKEAPREFLTEEGAYGAYLLHPSHIACLARG